MVFSKSPVEACAGASLKYFSLCLPISITSLFCRKCFLIGLPLTKVPLVEFRSSMNESLRMVMMAACSPETAKLSTWISLCGLRPRIVRSLVSVISLRTVPSTLKISFAIALTLRKFYQLHFGCLNISPANPHGQRSDIHSRATVRYSLTDNRPIFIISAKPGLHFCPESSFDRVTLHHLYQHYRHIVPAAGIVSRLNQLLRREIEIRA